MASDSCRPVVAAAVVVELAVAAVGVAAAAAAVAIAADSLHCASHQLVPMLVKMAEGYSRDPDLSALRRCTHGCMSLHQLFCARCIAREFRCRESEAGIVARLAAAIRRNRS